MKYLILYIITFYTVVGFSQESSDGRNMTYKFERSFNLNIHSLGMGLGYNSGKIKGIYKTNYWNYEFSSYRHPKENRISRIIGAYNSFTYGKQNVFMNLKVGKSTAKRLIAKAEKKGVRIDNIIGLGANIGILKPYYVDVTREGFGYSVPIKYEGEDKSDFLNVYRITGGAGFTKGLFESTFVPGGYLDYGFQFSYGEYREFVRSISVGGRFDLYSRTIPIMVLAESKPYFLTLYARIAIGWRSY